jgi:HK97 family phage prohead protease
MTTATKDRERIATKTFRAEVKAEAPAPGATEGTFDARVAAFGNVDLQNDRIEPTAFDGTKADWEASGDPVPVIWSHQWDDPMMHIGSVDPKDLTVDDEGLNVHGVIDLENPLGKQVHRLMVDRRVKEFSFAYQPTEAAPDPDDENVRVLKAVDLIEVGPTLKGANPETELLGAKDLAALADLVEGKGGSDDGAGPAETKYGRVLSKANEAKLREAGGLIDAVLASLSTSGDDEASDDEDDDKSRTADRTEARSSTDTAAARLRLLELGGPL